MNISVVGRGKLGSPIVAVLTAKAHTVIGVDTNSSFVEKITNHIASVEEPRLQQFLTQRKPHISATSNLLH
jgi:UDP-glucose 6-dehydrogenase